MINVKNPSIVLAFLFISFPLVATLHWDWSHININDIVLPPLCGVSMSEYQNSGAINCPDSNWAHWEAQGTINGYPTIDGNQTSGIACDFWNNYKNDIQLIKELGCNALRLSVEWSIIEPQKGKFNQAAMDHYKDVCNELIANGITPMITLHHFTHPQWFEERGGFEREENIRYFVRFCERIFMHLQDQVKLWCTINEIGPYAFQGYIHGAFPPGKHNIYTAATVMKHMLIAHVDVYNTLKALPGGKDTQIGIVHQYLSFESHSYISVLEHIPSLFMNYVFNDAIVHFLKTGELFPRIPLLRRTIVDAPDAYDFIGLNFYSRVVLKSNIFDKLINCDFSTKDIVAPACLDGEIMTDMEYPIYPEGLYIALKEMAQLGKPIYVTENGVPDGNDDRRPLYIKRYLYALSQAIKEGVDVRGYFYWSLMDNFEWDRGYNKKFGLYEADFTTQKRSLRPGAQCYQRAIQTSSRV
ncbi:MAG TPA: family 1 glycosylhydrolase [Candidatus Dependentiae bacterium]|nr:family 1 glycosylhydrolase [Candidatus Dependentiae bacterium]HRQ62817.1 family 1 glycosylhydrolase [Candidatus Dependentiae bacterium]